MVKEQVGKGAILTAAVGCISAGVALVKEGNIEFGVALVVAGLAVAAIYVYLMEKQAVKKALEGVESKIV